jgi:hypothetical protein
VSFYAFIVIHFPAEFCKEFCYCNVYGRFGIKVVSGHVPGARYSNFTWPRVCGLLHSPLTKSPIAPNVESTSQSFVPQLSTATTQGRQGQGGEN